MVLPCLFVCVCLCLAHQVSAHFGFKDECKVKYGLTVYYRFLLAFQVQYSTVVSPLSVEGTSRLLHTLSRTPTPKYILLLLLLFVVPLFVTVA